MVELFKFTSRQPAFAGVSFCASSSLALLFTSKVLPFSYRCHNYKPQLPLTFSQGIRPKGDNVRSGSVGLRNGVLGYVGRNGDDWSRIAATYGTSTWNTNTYALYFDTHGTHPSNLDVRWYGRPVRCLVY